jgi:flagellar assembly factor FliW
VHFESRRFGSLDLADDQVIEFPSGLIGLGGSRYALVSTDDDSPFRWLQSLEDPGLALPSRTRFWFFADYASSSQTPIPRAWAPTTRRGRRLGHRPRGAPPTR